jgi:hypothetical protein
MHLPSLSPVSLVSWGGVMSRYQPQVTEHLLQWEGREHWSTWRRPCHTFHTASPGLLLFCSLSPHGAWSLSSVHVTTQQLYPSLGSLLGTGKNVVKVTVVMLCNPKLHYRLDRALQPGAWWGCPMRNWAHVTVWRWRGCHWETMQM